MPNKRGCQTRRKTLKTGSPMGSNQSSDHSKAGHAEAGHSKANHFELGAERAPPVPREASEDCSGEAYDGENPDQECFDSHQEHIDKVIWRLIQNHNRLNSGRRYCLLITVHEATNK